MAAVLSRRGLLSALLSAPILRALPAVQYVVARAAIAADARLGHWQYMAASTMVWAYRMTWSPANRVHLDHGLAWCAAPAPAVPRDNDFDKFMVDTLRTLNEDYP